ncbi:hypothetical protein F5B20DRAFT_472940 [Whalleya microplaca]|nr:hypothetical protein F5B20DRAFT_472940 [Whalleya microplaca]
MSWELVAFRCLLGWLGFFPLNLTSFSLPDVSGEKLGWTDDDLLISSPWLLSVSLMTHELTRHKRQHKHATPCVIIPPTPYGLFWSLNRVYRLGKQEGLTPICFFEFFVSRATRLFSSNCLGPFFAFSFLRLDDYQLPTRLLGKAARGETDRDKHTQGGQAGEAETTEFKGEERENVPQVSTGWEWDGMRTLLTTTYRLPWFR